MSELKDYNIMDIEAMDDERLEKSESGRIQVTRVYIKSEIDKLIAEKNEEIAELQRQVHDYAQGLYEIQARAENELHHNKYKRCLAMANWCFSKSNYHHLVGREEGGQLAKDSFRRSDLYLKWCDRWQKLAEQFKEAK